MVVISQRVRPLKLAEHSLIRLRNKVFDGEVAGRLGKQDSAVICAYSAAVQTLSRSLTLNIRSFLDYPIAHHRYAETLLWEEAARQPDYAPTLQFHRFSSQARLQLESEIDLANRIFVLSTFQKGTFVDAGVDERKLIVTPLGVDLALFRQRSKRVERDRFRILFVGQVTQRKGISYLVEAFRRAKIPNSELVLVGRITGTDKPWRAVPGIRYLPHVPRWELPELYASADVYVLPSLVEGFAQTALEAMACGLPVILSENTFASDIVTNGVDGYIVPIRNADAIVDRLRYLHNHRSECERMGLASRRRSEDFSWETYARRVIGAVSGGTGVGLMRGRVRSNAWEVQGG